jgi:hypothetical protein
MKEIINKNKNNKVENNNTGWDNLEVIADEEIEMNTSLDLIKNNTVGQNLEYLKKELITTEDFNIWLNNLSIDQLGLSFMTMNSNIQYDTFKEYEKDLNLMQLSLAKKIYILASIDKIPEDIQEVPHATLLGVRIRLLNQCIPIFMRNSDDLNYLVDKYKTLSEINELTDDLIFTDFVNKSNPEQPVKLFDSNREKSKKNNGIDQDKLGIQFCLAEESGDLYAIDPDKCDTQLDIPEGNREKIIFDSELGGIVYYENEAQAKIGIDIDPRKKFLTITSIQGFKNAKLLNNFDLSRFAFKLGAKIAIEQGCQILRIPAADGNKWTEYTDQSGQFHAKREHMHKMYDEVAKAKDFKITKESADKWGLALAPDGKFYLAVIKKNR